jgi:Mrp family chromosome partitioning ATPase
VDADLRRPTLHTCFQLNGERGLTAWLRGEQAVEDAGLLPTAVERLRLLPAGPAAASSARLLLSSRMAALLAALAADADVVVLDGPALLETAGTSLLAGQVDGTLLVVRSGATPAADITQAAALLAQDGAHLLGAVLNRAPGRRAMRLAGYPVRYQGERGGAQC